MLTVRMNWMDAERSQSADVQLSKDSKDIPVYHRNKLYHHRAQVASVIRQQLAAIQRELNGDPDEHQSEQAKATEAITALIKGQRYRDGKLFTSYIDGTSHEGTEIVRAYNSYCRHRLDAFLAENTDITAIVPDESEFDISGIERLIDEESSLADAGEGEEEDSRSVLRKKIDAARAEYNTKAQKCSRYLTSFVAIRNARLSEGFDFSALNDQPSHSPSVPEDANADDLHEDSKDSEADSEPQGEQHEEEPDAPLEEAKSDNELNEDDIEAPLVLRDGTVALDGTAAPHE